MHRAACLAAGAVLFSMAGAQSPAPIIRPYPAPKSPWLASKAAYIDFGPSLLGRAATEAQKAEIGRAFAWMKDNLKDYEGARPATAPWEAEFSTFTTFRSQKVISYAQNGESYAGGAHGSHTVVSRTFFVKEGRAVPATVQDLLTTAAAVEALDQRLLCLLAIQGASFYDEALPLTLGSLMDNFHITQFGVTWRFAPYDVASYAEGSFQVTIPWGDLGDEVNPRLRP